MLRNSKWGSYFAQKVVDTFFVAKTVARYVCVYSRNLFAKSSDYVVFNKYFDRINMYRNVFQFERHCFANISHRPMGIVIVICLLTGI